VPLLDARPILRISLQWGRALSSAKFGRRGQHTKDIAIDVTGVQNGNGKGISSSALKNRPGRNRRRQLPAVFNLLPG
jgi:hypothetical protein